jgi:hypothetical protein
VPPVRNSAISWIPRHDPEGGGSKYPGQLVFDYKAPVVIPRNSGGALRSGLIDMVMTAASYTTAVMRMNVMSLTS